MSKEFVVTRDRDGKTCADCKHLYSDTECEYGCETSPSDLACCDFEEVTP